MDKCFAITTALGNAMVADSIRLGTKIDLVEMAIGDANYTPEEGQTSLMHERARVPITEILADVDNPSWLRIMAVLPPDMGGWNIHEVGIFAEGGNMFAVAKMDGSYKPVYADGMVKEIALDIVLEVSSEANINLSVDPHVIIATRQWVIDYVGAKIANLKSNFEKHIKDKNNPHETTAEQVDAYTKAEVDAMIKEAMLNAVPPGIITVWRGTLLDIPQGWVLCDGKNGTPDMRDCFVMGGGGKYAINSRGGKEKHIHNVSGVVSNTTLTVEQMPYHNHYIRVQGAGSGEASCAPAYAPGGISYTSSEGRNQPHNHIFSAGATNEQSSLPPYFVKAWIMKK